ncbi:MAG: glycosyltransferase [Cytophagales bacterium]|nr:glycosyltransferase [Cytophagales bacterium]
MTRHVIAIISVLKPIDDTRNYEKIARTISNTNKYEINIIGFSAKKNPTHPNITFHPLFRFGRTGIARLGASFKIFKKLLKVKPEIVMVTCAELLIVSIVYKILFGSKIIYDIQENYYRNIAYTNVYPPLVKYPVAMLTRAVELVSCRFADRCFLAEKVYRRQLRFAASKSAVIENKALIPPVGFPAKKTSGKTLTFLYCGTIAEHYGVFEAIGFVARLKASLRSAKLIIAGYSAHVRTYQKLRAEIAGMDFIQLIGGDHLVPHSQILNELNRADFCLLPYRKSKSTEGRIPTKLFECLAMEKPIIISPNPAWDSIVKKNNAGIIHDFSQLEDFPEEMLNKRFYGNDLSGAYRWENNSELLRSEIQRVLSGATT